MTVSHNRLRVLPEDVGAASEVISSGHWACGAQVEALEGELARAAAVRHAVCVSSGYAALRLSLRALGIGLGDRVVVPAYSCVALPNAVLACGAEPVPLDIELEAFALDVRAVAEAMAHYRSIKAILAVNMFGCPAPITELRTLGVPVVEDCAHAFGDRVGGKLYGSRGDVATLSFYATKLLHGGEGGAVLSDREEVADFVRHERDYSNKPPSAVRMNDKMTDLEAALVRSHLRRLPAEIGRRETLARQYSRALAASQACVKRLALPQHVEGRVWYRYPVCLKRLSAGIVITALKTRGVEAARPVAEWLPATEAGRYPAAAAAYRHTLSLPLYPGLTDEDQARVVAALDAALPALEPA